MMAKTERHELVKTLEDYWALTAIHEAAHGIICWGLDCHPVKLVLLRKYNPLTKMSGYCQGKYSKTGEGQYKHVFVANAPFACAEFLPSGEKQDLQEREDAWRNFVILSGREDEEGFRKYVDNPLVKFFSVEIVQHVVVLIAGQLSRHNQYAIYKNNEYANLIPRGNFNDLRNSLDLIMELYPSEYKPGIIK